MNLRVIWNVLAAKPEGVALAVRLFLQQTEELAKGWS